MISQVWWEEFLCDCILHLRAAGWCCLPRTLGSAAQVTSLHLAESCRAAELQSSRAAEREHNGRTSCERSQVPDTEWTWILGWRVGEGDGGHWRFCISTHYALCCSATSIGSVLPFLSYSCFAMIFWVQSNKMYSGVLRTEDRIASGVVCWAGAWLELINWHDTVTLSLYNWTNLPQPAHSHALTIH